MLNKKIYFLRKHLLNWFKENKRYFHWRKPRASFYGKLIAEIMLRRTTAKAVNSVYPIFIKKFPSFNVFIKANKNQVVEVIKPLGKYNQKYAILKSLAERFKKRNLTKVSAQDLLEIKGVGLYTANAFLCFAKGESLPIVDSNVSRIYSRYFGVKIINKNIANADIYQYAEKSLPKRNPSIYNMALLDFGAMICKNNKPECIICPIRKTCCFFNGKSG